MNPFPTPWLFIIVIYKTHPKTIEILLSEVVPCPAPSTSSSGGGFNLWSFMTAGVVAATVVGNIVDNVNDNNNNNNNNNNQDNQNSNNMNINNNDNMNMNMNMLNMAMGRGLLEEWVEDEMRTKKKKIVKEEMKERIVKREEKAEMEKEEKVGSTHWAKEMSSSSRSFLNFQLIFSLVCKLLSLWMEVS